MAKTYSLAALNLIEENVKELDGLIYGSFQSSGRFCAVGSTGVKGFAEFAKLFPGDARRADATARKVATYNDQTYRTPAERKQAVLAKIQDLKRDAD